MQTQDKPFTSSQISMFREFERASDYDIDVMRKGLEPTAVVRFKKAHKQFKIGEYLQWKREAEE